MSNFSQSRSHAELTNVASVSNSPGRLGRDRALINPPLPGDWNDKLVIDKIGEHPVGCGGYSDVWKAKMTKNDGQMSLVALKVLRSTRSDPDRFTRRFRREVACWRVLHHESVAPFYGIIYEQTGEPGLVSPWYKNGTADAYLEAHPDVNPVQIVWEIVVGIEYLHNMNVVHGDLKGANVMIDDNGHARLIDFGLSRIIDSEVSMTTSSMSSIRWCAPELLNSDDARVTKASDVYAVASTALELLTGRVPYDTLADRVVPLTVINGVRPRGLSSGFRYNILRSRELWDLLEMCWEEAPRRPGIRAVKLGLRKFLS